MDKREINIKLSEDDLWNAYVSLYNLTTGEHRNFYEKQHKELSVKTRDKIYQIGKERFKW